MDENVKTKIEYEISRIDRLLSDAKPLLDLCKIKEPDFVEITAVAQILHSFYNGVESVIILILKGINENLPNDSRWHKTLFDIAFGQNQKHFKIFRDDIKSILNDYLSMRHFIRHSYTSEFEWSEMEILAKSIEETWKIIKLDFELFIENN